MFKRRIPQTTFQRLRQFFWPREGWWRATKYLWQRTIRLSGTPHSIALGLAIGAFASANPVLGTHILWCGLSMYFVGGNFIAAVLGTWVGNPGSFPFIWLATFGTGNFLLGRNDEGRELPELSFSLIVEAPMGALLPVIGPMMIGWLPVGLILGIAVYYPSLWSIEAYQRQRIDRLERKRSAAAKKGANKN